jgi:hypothetical protein
MVMHTVGPETAHEDEVRIGKAYQTWLTPFLALGPLVALKFFEPDSILVVVSGIGLVLLHEAGGRLHDLCIRVRRTNILLQSLNSKP